MTQEIDNYYKDGSGFEYCHLEIKDEHNQDMSPLFTGALEFIEKSIEEKKNILIHCKFGSSRSATITLLYLIKRHNYTFEEAQTILTKKREVNINKVFLEQLKDYCLDNNLINTQLHTHVNVETQTKFEETTLEASNYDN